MKILSIDTSCDETSVSVTEDTRVLSNIIWSQAAQHAEWGGVFPSLAQRLHRERIDWTIEKALATSHQSLTTNIDAIAVTKGPGLAIALEVGITKAKELATNYHKPLIAVNHIEAHLLSSLAEPRITNYQLPISNQLSITKFPSLGLVISGGHTDLILIKKIGDYEILASTQDDALGEALDKAARMLGLGYPGGATLEKMARSSDSGQAHQLYPLPLPMAGRESEGKFSFSGLKTAMYRLVDKEKPLTKTKIQDLAATFQKRAFDHLCGVITFQIKKSAYPVKYLLVGGGVANNIEVRKRLRKICQPFKIKVLLPYSKKLCGDNAAMIGVAAYFKAQRKEFVNDISSLDREPRMKLS